MYNFKENLTLAFKTGTVDDVTFDEETGAPIFSGETTEYFSASVEPKQKPTAITIEGVDETSLYLEGRCEALPDEALRSGQYLDAQYLTPTGLQLEGRFYLLPATQGRLGLESVFGHLIRGWLVIQS